MDSLAALVRRNGPLDPIDAAGWGIRLAKRVEELHRLGVAHGAISAECIQAAEGSPRGRGVLVDVRSSPVLAAYHSPERLAGGGISLVDDTWAVGVTLHFLAAGVLPYPGDTAPEVADRMMSGQLPNLPGDSPQALRLGQILIAHLVRERSNRQSSLPALRQQLEAMMPVGVAAIFTPLEEQQDRGGDTLETDLDDEDDEDAATVMKDFSAIREQIRKGELPEPLPSDPGGGGPPRAGGPPRTERLPAMPVPRPAAGVPAAPRPMVPQPTIPLPRVRAATLPTAVAGPMAAAALPGAGLRGLMPGAVPPGAGRSPLAPPGLGVPSSRSAEPAADEEEDYNDESTLMAPGKAFGAVAPGPRGGTPGPTATVPMPQVLPPAPGPREPAEAEPPQPQAGASAGEREEEEEEEDDGALATVVMAGLDASALNDQVESALAAQAAEGAARASGPGAPPRPAAGAPPLFSPAASPFATALPGGLGALASPGPAAGGPGGGPAPGVPFAPEPTVDEPRLPPPPYLGAARGAAQGPWQPAGFALGQGPAPMAGPPGLVGGPPPGPAAGGYDPPLAFAPPPANAAAPAPNAQALPWPAPAPAPGLPDVDELEELAAQDRRLRRMLAVAIVVLILVLAAVAMLWLRRAGLVAF